MFKCAQCTLQRISAQRIPFGNLTSSNQLHIKKQPEKETVNIEPEPREQKGVPNIPDEYKRVFNFPYIRHFAVINSLKIYQTGITGIITSGALILNQLEYVSTDMLEIIVVSGIAACAPLYILGYLTGNFIGYIYYNEKTDMAIIAYVDHWGRRKDLELPVGDIIPLEDLPVTRWSNLWFKFERYSTKKTLKLNTKYAIFVDKEALKKII